MDPIDGIYVRLARRVTIDRRQFNNVSRSVLRRCRPQ
jgi:hypothetical protein